MPNILEPCRVGDNNICIDSRESLVNDRAVGPIELVQISRDCVTSIHGFMIDVDPKNFRTDGLWGVTDDDPVQLYDRHLKPALDRHPVLSGCEVRCSGTGLHLLIWFDTPVELMAEKDRNEWEARIRILQAVVPSDPLQPGITAVTRPTESINSKNGGAVCCLRSGTRMPAAQVIDLVESICHAPAKWLLQFLFGSDTVRPCPCCHREGTGLKAFGWKARAYGCCGDLSLEQLIELVMKNSQPGESSSDESIGSQQVEKLRRGLRLLEESRHDCGLRPKLIRGVTAQGVCNRPISSVIGEVGHALAQSGKVFRFGDDVVLEVTDHEVRRLVTLMRDGKMEPQADTRLVPILVCASGHDDESMKQYQLPGRVLQVALQTSAVLNMLATILQYSRCPTYSRSFRFMGPGWHSDEGVLIHGPDIEVRPLEPFDLGLPLLQRLPQHLQGLFAGFCFLDASDLANAIAALMTGLLAAHFVEDAKPLIPVDGNQPAVGKSLLVQCFGVVLDGEIPAAIPFTSENEELGKRICARIRCGNQSLVFIDNGRVAGGSVIESTVLESTCTAPVISLRVLGQSTMLTRPNDLLWLLTMNGTRLNADLASRSMPIRLQYEGDPAQRTFVGGPPIEYARRYRLEILGELLGMVQHWITQQCPPGRVQHRCQTWAAVVGGILIANGVTEFLANLQDSMATFDAAREQLSALAEVTIQSENVQRRGFAFHESEFAPAVPSTLPFGLSASDWVLMLERAGINLHDRHPAPALTARQQAVRAGQILKGFVGRECIVEVAGRVFRARLQSVEARSNGKRYYFRVTDTAPQDSPQPAVQTGSAA